MSTLELDFSGIGLRVAGLPDDLARRLAADWAAFLAPAQGPLLLQADLSPAEGEAEPGPFRPKLMKAVLEVSRARFEMPEGEAAVGDDGVARIRLARGSDATAYFTMMNLLRACLAWRLPARGGAMLHAAGLVIDGRAFLLVGPEGSGKSAWARLGEQGGGRALSDDIVLVEGGEAGVEALGSPLRSTHRSDYRPGRWPVAAILFPRHGPRAAWTRCDPLRARARIAANLPFVQTAIEWDERVAAVVERLATEVSCKELTFALDASFVDLLRAGDARDG